jgi:hypothetical protein
MSAFLIKLRKKGQMEMDRNLMLRKVYVKIYLSTSIWPFNEKSIQIDKNAYLGSLTSSFLIKSFACSDTEPNKFGGKSSGPLVILQ